MTRQERHLSAVVAPDLAQPPQWATRINRQMGEAVEAILATGRALAEAKKALKHGGWERLFAGHPEAVREPVGLSVSTAKRMMFVAENKVISNRAHGHALPPSRCAPQSSRTDRVAPEKREIPPACRALPREPRKGLAMRDRRTTRSMCVLMAGLALVGLASVAQAEPDMRVGIYPGGNPQYSLATIDSLNEAIGAQGLRFGFIGDFIELDHWWTPTLLVDSLETAWQKGAVPFINVMPAGRLEDLLKMNTVGYTMIWRWASTIRRWAEQGEGRHVYLALYPEANGQWAWYHTSGAVVAEAQRMLIYVFHLVGARQHVRFVFAPDAGAVSFEQYYPGHQWMDAVAFSSFTSCDGTLQDYDAIIRPPIERMRRLAPGKPIILAQTGSCTHANAPHLATVARREAWAKTLWTRLRDEPDVIGALWFDWRIPADPADGYPGAIFDLPRDSWRRAVAPLDPRVN